MHEVTHDRPETIEASPAPTPNELPASLKTDLLKMNQKEAMESFRHILKQLGYLPADSKCE